MFFYLSGINNIYIGAEKRYWWFFDGIVDDFRIYDYALSQAEVAYAATNGTGVFNQPLLTPADTDGNNIIDFRDFAVLAENWLKIKLYP